MKYKHKKSGVSVKWDNNVKQYTNRDFIKNVCEFVWLNKNMVEDSDDWIKLCTDIEEIKQLQNIPCLSINDVGRVFVTANRFREHKNNNEYDLERQGRELLEIVKQKLNK